MSKFIYIFGIVFSLVATYIYLDWGIMQILGVAFVLTTVNEASKDKPFLQRFFWVLLAFSLMISGHFLISNNLMYWGAILLAIILLFICITLLYQLFNTKPGDGSVLTAYVLGIIIFFPTAIFVLYKGIKGLGYW